MDNVEDHGAPAEPEPTAPRKRPRRLRWLWGVTIFLLLLVAFAGWVSFRVLDAYNHLTAAKAAITSGTPGGVFDLGQVDRDHLAAAITQAQGDAAAARADVADPVFRLAEFLPWVGDDLSAVSSIATTVDDVAGRVLPAMLTLADIAAPSALEPHDGSITLGPFLAAAPALSIADRAATEDSDRIAAIDRSTLTSAVHTAVDDLSARLVTLRTVTATGARMTRLLPPMLGSQEPRRYLVVFQNLAELRSTGGIFGSYAVLTATNGHLTVSGQGATSRTMGRFATPVAELTAEELNLYDTNVGTVPMDVNFTPDFPMAAKLFATMYQDRIDSAPLDGVIAVDPVALAGVLRGFDPVVVQGQTLTADTIVKVLLSDAYSMFPDDQDQSQRDAFLANANAAAFNVITTTPNDMRAVLAGLRDGMDTRRILLYSSHSDEQTELRTIGATGELPEGDTVGSPTFGVFLSDRTYKGSKLGYYLSGAVDVTAGGCPDDGTRDVTVLVHLNFGAPNSGLPEHVSGSGPEPYVLVTEFRVFAPTGASTTAAEFNGAPLALTTGTDLNRSVGRFTVDLQPGSSNTLTVHFVLPASSGSGGQPVQPTLLVTPGVTTWPLTAPAFPGCD